MINVKRVPPSRSAGGHDTTERVLPAISERFYITFMRYGTRFLSKTCSDRFQVSQIERRVDTPFNSTVISVSLKIHRHSFSWYLLTSVRTLSGKRSNPI